MAYDSHLKNHHSYPQWFWIISQIKIQNLFLCINNGMVSPLLNILFWWNRTIWTLIQEGFTLFFFLPPQHETKSCSKSLSDWNTDQKRKKQRGSKEFIKNCIVSTAIWKILLSLCEQHSQMQHFVSLAQNLWMNSSIESKL